MVLLCLWILYENECVSKHVTLIVFFQSKPGNHMADVSKNSPSYVSWKIQCLLDTLHLLCYLRFLVCNALFCFVGEVMEELDPEEQFLRDARNGNLEGIQKLLMSKIKEEAKIDINCKGRTRHWVSIDHSYVSRHIGVLVTALHCFRQEQIESWLDSSSSGLLLWTQGCCWGPTEGIDRLSVLFSYMCTLVCFRVEFVLGILMSSCSSSVHLTGWSRCQFAK